MISRAVYTVTVTVTVMVPEIHKRLSDARKINLTVTVTVTDSQRIERIKHRCLPCVYALIMMCKQTQVVPAQVLNRIRDMSILPILEYF
jgi:hypothetical protein